MRTKWLSGLGVLGVVMGLMLLSPDPADGQQGPGGKKGMKGGFTFGGPGGQGGPQMNYQIPQGGQGGPGGMQGYGMQQGGPGGYGMMGKGGDRGGDRGPGGDRGYGGDRGPGMMGKGGDRGPGGPGGMMGKGMGGDPMERADKTFTFLARSTGGEVIDMGKMEPASRSFVRNVFEKYGVPPPRDTDVIGRQQFVSMVGPAMARMSGGGPGGDRGGDRGPGGYGDPNRSYNDPSNNWGSDPSRGGKDDKREGRDRRDDRKEKEPEVFAVRYGKLPDGLPLWWSDYDTNKDGQIGLHEWRLKDEPTAKFYEMDLDGDGLLTPDEYLRYKNRVEESEKVAALAKAAEDGDDRPTRPSYGGGGDRFAGMGGDRTGGQSKAGTDGPNPFRKGGNKEDANATQGGERPGRGEFMKGKGSKGSKGNKSGGGSGKEN